MAVLETAPACTHSEVLWRTSHLPNAVLTARPIRVGSRWHGSGASEPTMENIVEQKKAAWQPFTFRGVAAFSQAGPLRVLFWQIMALIVTTGVLTWFLRTALNPVIQEALNRVPEQAALRQGRWAWGGPAVVVMGKSPFFAIIVDLENNQPPDQLADLQCELNRSQFKLRSILGFISLPYPRPWDLKVDRIVWESWWGAWRPFVLVGGGLLMSAGVLVMWWALAAIYAAPVRLLARLLKRQAGWVGAWKLSSAALMPGALWMNVAIVLYGLRQLELVGFLCAVALHFLIGWIYLLLAPAFLPARSPMAKAAANPFARREKA